MNREIKFRAWDLSNERMVYYPYLFEPMADFRGTNEYNASFVFFEDWQDVDDGIWRPCHIMQYTGLKDKNGKEIYEGDKFKSILSHFNYYYVCHEDGCFVMKYKIGNKEFVWGKIDRCIELLKEWDIFEIIGNIYENPELLK